MRMTTTPSPQWGGAELSTGTVSPVTFSVAAATCTANSVPAAAATCTAKSVPLYCSQKLSNHFSNIVAPGAVHAWYTCTWSRNISDNSNCSDILGRQVTVKSWRISGLYSRNVPHRRYPNVDQTNKAAQIFTAIMQWNVSECKINGTTKMAAESNTIHIPKYNKWRYIILILISRLRRQTYRQTDRHSGLFQCSAQMKTNNFSVP
jgi:hypothetical protein